MPAAVNNGFAGVYGENRIQVLLKVVNYIQPIQSHSAKILVFRIAFMFGNASGFCEYSKIWSNDHNLIGSHRFLARFGSNVLDTRECDRSSVFPR